MEQVGNPALWAQYGGLNGLVILALFALILIFIRSISKIIDNHRNDLTAVMQMHAKEREEWGKIVDARQKETNISMQAMAAALNKISQRQRRYLDHGEDEAS